MREPNRAPRPADVGAPTHEVEIERKYDVDAETPMWECSGLPGVAHVGAPQLRALDAVYFDTADLALSRAAVALRRRTGGPDAGWHLKTTAPEGRHEYGWPLEDDRVGLSPAEITVPARIIASVQEWAAGAELFPLARLENARSATALKDAAHGVIAEITDDHVRATDLRDGGVTVWREWEVELGPAAPVSDAERAAFFAAVDVAVAVAGGRPSASDSKLQRALGR